MKTLFAIVAAAFVSVSSFAQGTLIFNNRNLTGPNGVTYNAPIQVWWPDPSNATAQMFLVTGTGAAATFTALTPVNTFRPAPNQWFLAGPVVVTVPGQAAGTTGLQFVVRAWQGANYDAAALRAQSGVFTVGPLGGVTTSGEIFLPPDLGGPGGVGGFQGIVIWPEPSSTALALLGAAILLARRRNLKDFGSFCTRE
jgi:hypothetical protein